MAFDHLFRQPEPVIPVRGVHFDLKGLPPTPQRWIELLDLLAAMRFNAVLVEWEDTFPWTVDPRFRCETAYTPEDVRAFATAADERGIELIPLVQCLGHLETPLSVPGYEFLREVDHQSNVLNPLADSAAELVAAMIDDVLALLPDTRHFHLGGDEAWSFGTHPETAAFIEEHGKGALYLHHVEPLLQRLNDRDVRPILWHDMMREWDAEALARLRDQADLCVWGYQGHPDQVDRHYSTKVTERFVEHGLTLWGGTAYKGADGHDSDLPVPANRELNGLAWAEVAQRFGMEGVFTTAWSRYSTHDVQCEPIDGALDCLLLHAVILHDGQSPEGGIEACREALANGSEGERFTQLHDALSRLSGARKRGWHAVQILRQWVVTATLDSRRRTSGTGPQRLGMLQAAVEAAELAAEDVRAAMDGSVDGLWVERYLAERVEPLKVELGELGTAVGMLDPVGVRG